MYVLVTGAVKPRKPLQSPEAEGSADRRQVAIIGGGITGASAAYFLNELTRQRVPIDITIYEMESRVGGRVKSADLYEWPRSAVEVGAAGFSDDDWCLMRALDEVGLKPRKGSRRESSVGLWNGTDIVFIREHGINSVTWRDFAWSVLRYGLSPWNFRKASLRTLQYSEEAM